MKEAYARASLSFVLNHDARPVGYIGVHLRLSPQHHEDRVVSLGRIPVEDLDADVRDLLSKAAMTVRAWAAGEPDDWNDEQAVDAAKDFWEEA